ncbi:hypothetical protein [Paractinoplanes atraurantiacus]|uniref:Uncharacterized protein n=1 Tax=Paractinoplanes atraurantiacus TaxID=1036182 RepID=A0A285HIH4_9ACTN|nr:hypothetical protein [Actinoplanes atraurantiacus]SNY34586.1 hypothetical protein SAMN05421748_104305 [Actinoplanes atraurantiacus]
MDSSQLPEPLRARMAEQASRSSLEKVRSLIRGHVADTDGIDEVRSQLRMTAAHTTTYLRQDLDAIDAVLTEPLPPNTLLYLVAGDGGWPLDDDPTDAGASAFLRELARMIREIIDEAERARH